MFRILEVLFCTVFILLYSGGGGGGVFYPSSYIFTVSSAGLPVWGRFVILCQERVVIGELCPGAPFR